MNYDDFKDLVQNFNFEKFKAGQTVLEINTSGDAFYIILKGIVRVMVKNPQIKDWNFHYKYFKKLKAWKVKFDKRVEKTKNERFEKYQQEI